MTQLLEIDDLLIRRNDRTVLQVSHLEVLQNETLALIGPNGAGKSTLLLVLGRLIRAVEGKITWRGQSIQTIPELNYRRRIGLVLQDPLLFAGTVLENVMIGLRFRSLPRKQVHNQAMAWLERLGIAHLSGRRAHTLSGGEAQRVSLARAFALEPELLLLDEPFGALDAPTRARMRDDFHDLLAQTSQTTVFVTHDLDEALLLGDRVVVLMDGQIRQVGCPETVFTMPTDAGVAAFVGAETLIPGQVVGQQNSLDGERLTLVQADRGYPPGAPSPLLACRNQNITNGPVLVCLRPEAITLVNKTFTPGMSGNDPAPTRLETNRLAGQIVRLTPQGALVRVAIDCGFSVIALVTHLTSQEMKLHAGQTMDVSFSPEAAHLIAV